MPGDDAARYRDLQAEVRALRAAMRDLLGDMDAAIAEAEAMDAQDSVERDKPGQPDVDEAPRPPIRRAGLGRGLDALIPPRSRENEPRDEPGQPPKPDMPE